MPYRIAILNSHPIQYFAALYRRLDKVPSLELDVYFWSDKGLTEYYDAEFGINLKWDIPLVGGYRYILISKDPLKALARMFLGGYDAILIHGYSGLANLSIAFFSRLFGMKVLMRSDANYLHLKKGWGALKKVCIRCVFGMYDAFLAAGSSNRDFYKALGVPDGKIFLMPLSVDNQFFAAECENHIRNAAATQRELGIESEFPTILYVGKMSARKRPADLLMAYANLVKSNVKANLVYVGDGVERKKLADYVSEFKLPRVFFLGFRNQSELPKFYAISHMFVIPSFDEPWGLVLNEAMCARLPVIATDRIGACEDLILNGDNGFLYECGDLESLTAKLKILVEDAELRARMGHRSFEIISKWSYEECVGGLMDALNYSLPGKVKKRLRQAF